MNKPTPEQRTIINAVRWCKRQRGDEDRRRDRTTNPVYREFHLGCWHGYDHVLSYLNRKLPKNFKVKI
jgi:hypothetical protein